MSNWEAIPLDNVSIFIIISKITREIIILFHTGQFKTKEKETLNKSLTSNYILT